MKRTNPASQNRRSLHWMILISSLAATLGLWGLFAQSPDGQSGNAASTSSAITPASAAPPIPTLVPLYESQFQVPPSLFDRARRPEPVTSTRSSR